MTGTGPDSDQKNEEEEEHEQPMSEWMKIMLEEMDRKRLEHDEGVEELARREERHGADAQEGARDDHSDDSEH